MKNIFKIPGMPAKKYLILIFCLLLTALPLFASAAEDSVIGKAASWVFGSIGAVLGAVIGWIAFVINYAIATIFGVAISILSYFISIVLQLNTNIVRSSIVTSGFKITLAVANLGFVLAIIVIAIMTILRYETYALKQTLWKLIAAAILVNFSLVIAGAILSFSDSLSLYFLNAFNPGGSGSSYDAFSTSLAGAFAPQRLFLNLNFQGQNVTPELDALQGAGKNFGATMVALMNIFFPTIFLIVTVIALGGLFIMLLIRYIYIGILVILMPLAWLAWILPLTSAQWKKWWSKFIEWTFFAPIVIFFIYLAIVAMGAASASQTNDPTAFLSGLGVQNTDNAIAGSVNNSLGGFTGDFAKVTLGNMLQMAMMISLLFAGLFMAKALGITFAAATVAGATAVTAGFGGFVKRRGMIAGGWAMNKVGVPTLAQKLQKSVGAKPQGALAKAYKYTGAEFAVQKLGQGIEAVHVATREGTVDEARKRVNSWEKRQMVNGFAGATNPERIAIMERAQKEGFEKDLDLKGYMKEKLFEAYRQEKVLYKDISEGKGAALSEKAINALASNDDGTLEEEIRRIVIATTKDKIGSNKNLGDIYGSYRDPNSKGFGGLNQTEADKWLKYLTKNIVTQNFNLISSVIPKLNSKERKNFDDLFTDTIRDLRTAGRNADADRFETDYRKIIANVTLGYTESGPASGAAAAPPPSGGGTTP